MTSLEAQWRVLEAGFDELSLWDLHGRHSFARREGIAVTPELSLAEVRDALVEALRAGLVNLYNARSSSSEPLDLEEALVLVAQDKEWDSSSAQCWVEVAITAEGERASQEVFQKYRARSPFLGLGIADPHSSTDEDQR